MTAAQATVLVVLLSAMILFVWGRWRYDIVALLALLASVFLGAVPAERAFSGFGHPAVITVAAVLVISRALQASGIVDRLASALAHTRHSIVLQIGATTSLTALFSGFMNNIGALALMLPVALRNASESRCRPSMILMPLSFASLLGGLVTLVGTPPNIIIATFRGQRAGEAFGMFDFMPVGLPVAAVGLLYITLVGWRLVPGARSGAQSTEERFRIDSYIAQATVPESSALVGAQVRKIEQLCADEVTVMAIIRGRRRLLAPSGTEDLEAGDILMLEGDAEALAPLFENSALVRMGAEELDPEVLSSPQVQVLESVVMPGSPLEGASMRGLKMHEHYGINLLAMARQGHPPMTRLGSVRFKVGDVLLLQGERTALRQVLTTLGCLPLEGRGLNLRPPARALLPVAVFTAAIVAAGLRVVPIEIAFVSAAAALLLSNAVTPREAYRSIEWPVIVLLGALIPVGESLQTTGATTLIAHGIVAAIDGPSVATMLTLLIVASMLLADLIHNSPTAILMAPIAAGIASELGLPADAFLMAVAIGSASPYLTPVGHPSNTLVMGPGGYRFGDYWRMGLPLDALIVAVAVPLLIWVWV